MIFLVNVRSKDLKPCSYCWGPYGRNMKLWPCLGYVWILENGRERKLKGKMEGKKMVGKII